MSYRLITRATLTIVAATGDQSTREVDVRAYPAPKRDAAGAITVDGQATTYRRTGGKGRGTQDRRYAYFPHGPAATSAYIEITEAEAAAMIGGTITITSITAPAAPTPVATPAPAAEPTPAEPVADAAPKAPRRVKGQAKATTEA